LSTNTADEAETPGSVAAPVPRRFPSRLALAGILV
jgi:hypothetical protein